MIVKISRDKFSELLAAAGRAISPNSPIPSLSGIKIDAQPERIECTGSDSDISIRVSADKSNDFVYEVEEPGSIVIRKAYISEIIRKIDSDVVLMEVTDGNLTTISGNKTQFNINGYKSSDYPLIDFSEAPKKFHLTGASLKGLVNGTAFATSTAETRPVLTGINLTSDQKTVTAVATDSFRFARKEEAMELPYSFNITVLGRSLVEISRSFEDEEIVHVSLSDKKVQFYTDNLMIQTRLIDGNFPDTSNFVPKSFGYELKISKSELESAINRSSFIKSDNESYSIVKLDMKPGEVVLSSRSQEIGSSTEVLQGAEFSGEPLTISFTSKYCLDALGGLEGDRILIRFVGTMKPFVLTSESDDSSLQLVLPVRAYD